MTKLFLVRHGQSQWNLETRITGWKDMIGWELMPAMTKGFMDKVIFPGIAYDYKPNGFMVKKWKKLKSITIITTMDTLGIVYRFIFGNAIRKAMITGTFCKMGYKTGTDKK